MNATIAKFGWPATLVAEFDHWVVLLRPAQPTLGSLVLAAKSDATAFGELPGAAHAELKTVTAAIEAALTRAVGRITAFAAGRLDALFAAPAGSRLGEQS